MKIDIEDLIFQTELFLKEVKFLKKQLRLKEKDIRTIYSSDDRMREKLKRLNHFARHFTTKIKKRG
jgi:hypothetical protein